MKSQNQRPVFRRILAGGLGVVITLGLGCRDATEPPGPPYLALVTFFDAPPAADITQGVSYLVQDAGGGGLPDRTIRLPQTDTAIVSLPPGVYRVTLQGLPSRCSTRYGLQQQVVLGTNINTGIARYFINCRPTLGFAVYSYGAAPDPEFIYHLTSTSGLDTAGVVGAYDSVFVAPLAPGTYSLNLAHVASHCTIVTDGGDTQRFTVVDSVALPFLAFSINCSDDAHRPRLNLVRGSYHDGAVAFIIKATDPERDIRRYFWDITDCSGTSVKLGGGLERGPLDVSRTQGDTVTILHAFELGLPDAALAGRCLLVRVLDQTGNTTPSLEYPLQETGTRPLVVSYNAYLVGVSAIRIALDALDPNGDLVGTVAAGRIRDGVLRTPDGIDDFLIRNAEGYLSLSVPDFPVGSPFPGPSDVNAMTVYLIDAGGNFSRYLDTDLFR